MTDERGTPASEDLGARADDATQRLRKVAESAEVAQKRAMAEITALEADLEKERLRSAEALEEQKDRYESDLRRAREEKEEAIAGAQRRLTEIEVQVTAAEERVETAERRAVEVERQIGDEEARVRGAASEWLRGQVEAIRREARQ
jgi:chemotaxis regulatin CheY-phosphate phosphatase CheZ